jgi:dsRNA-specific ribonuclease
LLQMQRYHRAILCWEIDVETSQIAKSIFSHRKNWIDPYYSLSQNHPNIGQRQPIDHDNWCASGNGVWYVVFPLPTRTRSEVEDVEVVSVQSSQSSKADRCAQWMRNESNAMPKFGISSIYINRGLWVQYLVQCADEAQILINNCGCQHAINTGENSNYQFDPDNIFCEPDPKFHDNIHKNNNNHCCLNNMIISRGSGGLYASIPEDLMVNEPGPIDCNGRLVFRKKLLDISNNGNEDLSRKVHELLDAMIRIVAEENNDQTSDLIATIPSSNTLLSMVHSGRDLHSILSSKYPEGPSIRFADIFKRRHPNHCELIDQLSLNPEHKLLRSITVVSKLTLNCLTSRTPNTEKTYSTRMQSTRTEQFEYSGPLNNTRQEKFRLHTHSNPLYLLSEFCRPVGKVCHYMIGLMAPSIIWRIIGLLQANEAREEFTKIMICDSQNTIPSSTSVATNDNQSHIDQSVCRPSLMLLFEAITPRMACEIVDSERLELLGDSLLKLVTSIEVFRRFPTKHEGFLTVQRMKTISNLFLMESCYRLGMHRFLRAVALSSGKQEINVRPPGMTGIVADRERRSFWNVNLWDKQKLDEADECSESRLSEEEILLTIPHFRRIFPNHQYSSVFVKPKIIADMVEALIGAYYLAGGETAGIAAVKAFGAWPKFEDVENSSMPLSSFGSVNLKLDYVEPALELSFPPDYPEPLRKVALGKQNYLTTVNDSTPCSKLVAEDKDNKKALKVLQNSLTIDDDSAGVTHSFGGYHPPEEIIPCLETIIGYRFRNGKILDEVFTHCSCSDRTSNQRLEFLGDAVLDFAVSTLLFEFMPWAQPGELATTRSMVTNNRYLGMVGAKLQLYRFLRFSSLKLGIELQNIHRVVEQSLGALQTTGKLNQYDSTLSPSICDLEAFRQLDVVDCPPTKKLKTHYQHHAETDQLRHENDMIMNQLLKPTVRPLIGNKKVSNRTITAASKSIADLFEALIGAIYLDCDCQLTVVRDVLLHIGLIPQLVASHQVTNIET